MRTSKFSEEQIIGFLRQVEAGMPIKELGRKHGFESPRGSWRPVGLSQTDMAA